MKFSIIILVFCTCVWAATADVAHIKAAKAKFLGRLAGKGKHHKRGILSPIPTFKLGHDIPHVTHSVLKPLVVTYPPTAAVAAVKIPVPNPHLPRHPVPVGHKVTGLPHPHYGLKFPHTKFVANPDHHFHHHHHHVAPRPVVPVVPAAPVPATPVTHLAPAAPIIPVPQPTIAVAHPAPAPPPPPVILPAPVIPSQPLPVSAPPLPIFPNHLHLKPLLPAATIPLAPAPTPLLPGPVFPLRQAVPYVIRPGGSVQSSFFATYPRFPLINSYQAPLFPLTPTAHAAPTIPQILPHVNPYNVVQQAVEQHGVVEHHTHNVLEQTPTLLDPTQVASHPGIHLHSVQESQPPFHLHPTQETLHQTAFNVHPTQETLQQPGFHLHPTPESLPQPGLHLHPTQEVYPQPGFHLQTAQASVPLQPTQPSLDHDGWSPVAAQPLDLATSHEGHYPQQTHHFTQEQGTQVFEHHTDNQYNDFQHQLQHHIQQQIEQAQYEQSLNNQLQPGQEYGVPQHHGQDFGQANDFSQQGQDFAQHAQDFAQHGQDFAQHGHDFSQHGQDFSQHGQDFAQHGQDFAQHGHDLGQQAQDFGQHNFNLAQPAQEYGLPQQGIEGRNADENEQQFHNHIPLGLQPPLDRPLDHFQ